jgi:hypothetical protein
MPYVLVKTTNNQIKYFWMILFVFCSGLFIYNRIGHNESFDNKNTDSSDQKAKKTKLNTRTIAKSKYAYIDPLLKSYNLGTCSKNCCATQWTVPIDLTERSGVNKRDVGKGRKFRASNLTCNNGVINTGCLCLTAESENVLSNRGYVKDLPQGNGLLNQDNRKSAFKVMEEEKLRKPTVLGQTTELTGVPGEDISMSGRQINKYDSRMDRYRSVESDIELSKQFSMPINTNIISIDHQSINDALVGSNISGNELNSNVDVLLSKPLGASSSDLKNISRK